MDDAQNSMQTPAIIAKAHIKDLLPDQLKDALVAMGEKPFRAKQIFHWLHTPVCTYDEMSDISKPLRAKLDEKFLLTVPTLVQKQVSKVDGTIKYLWQMHDGDLVESVLMRYEHGNTVCVSTQVGCRMGCTFCASGQLGLKRNLQAGEILDQILFIGKDAGITVNNIVLMGTGEPLDNYDQTLQFLRIVTHAQGINIGQRHISVSTSGLANRIEQLAGENLQITLSISLHAPDDESRSAMMPVNNSYPIARLMQACNYYFDTTGRRISYEYAMVRDKSDHTWQAEKVAALLRGRPAHVNLIPLNPVKESPHQPSTPQAVRNFQQTLERHGVSATVRRRLGPDIDAACGQLRRRAVTEMSTALE